MKERRVWLSRDENPDENVIMVWSEKPELAPNSGTYTVGSLCSKEESEAHVLTLYEPSMWGISLEPSQSAEAVIGFKIKKVMP